MTYDAKCFELAEYFLSNTQGLDTPEAADKVAQAIQAAIESEIEWLAQDAVRRYEAARDDAADRKREARDGF